MRAPKTHASCGRLRAALLFGSVLVMTSAKADDPPQFKLVQGDSKPLNGKPAELNITQIGDDSTYTLNAAVLSNGIPIEWLSGLGKTSELTFTGSVAKNTLAKKAQDVRSLEAAVVTVWSVTNRTSLFSKFGTKLEDDHLKGAQGHMERADFYLALPPFGGSDYKTGDHGAKIRVNPYVGTYSRHIDSTDDATRAPVGHYGGFYNGMHFKADFGTVSEGVNWVSSVKFEIDMYKVRDTAVSQKYRKDSYDFITATVSLALYDDEKSRWKPMLALTRAVGTDRLSNKDYSATTKFGIQLGYGI